MGGGTRDVFELARGADFVAYTELFLGMEYKNDYFPKAICPFHTEKSPSFSVNKKKNRGHCFGCQEDLSVIDFTAKFLQITPLEAATKICKDLGL